MDVQIGPVLYEDAPQELRSRMWWALLENPKLVSLLGTERVCCSQQSSPATTKFHILAWAVDKIMLNSETMRFSGEALWSWHLLVWQAYMALVACAHLATSFCISRHVAALE